jgi:hypothetical protein
MTNPGFGGLGSVGRVLGVVGLAAVVSAHVGSPDVFFSGKAGPYDIKVVVRPPEVVPGVARVTVKTAAGVTGVSIRPVYWRAGSKGSPAADAMRRAAESTTYEGSLWLMARGAYSVDVIVDGPQGKANVLVPVASVATGRLALDPKLGALLGVLGVFLVVGLVNIVRKAAGESLVEPGRSLDSAGVMTSRVAGGVALAVLALAVFGGSRWWRAVDSDYERSLYRPSPLAVSLIDGVLRVAATDTLYLPTGRPSGYVPDHGKLMHLFLVKSDDARAFAHLHPRADGAEIPAFTTVLPLLPAGTYNIFGDVVHETGFERTLVGSVTVPTRSPARAPKLDPDDAWFVGDAATGAATQIAADGLMVLRMEPTRPQPGEAVTLRISSTNGGGRPLTLEPYLGMAAHAVVARMDGSVYVHLHPMGTVSMAAQEVFAARDRGDTTEQGALLTTAHDEHQPSGGKPASPVAAVPSEIEFPYAFPRAGGYRVFVQVKRGGRVLTGAFAITVISTDSALIARARALPIGGR